MLAEAVTSQTGSARLREVRIAQTAGNPHRCIQADKKLVRRAVENLLSNALKYSPPGTEVTVTLTEVDDGIEIDISDRGCGVPEAFKSELFKKFGSVEAARGSVRRGFGLGLHLVNLVATAHGGRALVRDREGGGAVFGIFLPNRVLPA
jgi:signal transduction histidine kinase